MIYYNVPLPENAQLKLSLKVFKKKRKLSQLNISKKITQFLLQIFYFLSGLPICVPIFLFTYGLF